MSDFKTRTRAGGKFLLGIFFAMYAISAYGQRGNLPRDVDQQLWQLNQTLQNLERSTQYLQPDQKQAVAWQLDQSARQLQYLQAQLNRPGPGPGPRPGPRPIPRLGWIQTDGQACANVCASVGGLSALSPEGAQCVSGENRARSAFQAGIQFTYGMWPNNIPEPGPLNSQSFGGFCYKPGQGRDNDRSDITVGCFCR